MTNAKLPEELFAAHDWVDAAGQLDECRDDPTYAAEAGAELGRVLGDDVTESDLRSLGAWLREHHPAEVEPEPYTWTITFKVTAHPTIVADGFNPSDPERDRDDADVLRHVISNVDCWGEHEVEIELVEIQSPPLDRILREQGYDDARAADLIAIADRRNAWLDVDAIVDSIPGSTAKSSQASPRFVEVWMDVNSGACSPPSGAVKRADVLASLEHLGFTSSRAHSKVGPRGEQVFSPAAVRLVLRDLEVRP